MRELKKLCIEAVSNGYIVDIVDRPVKVGIFELYYEREFRLVFKSWEEVVKHLESMPKHLET